MSVHIEQGEAVFGSWLKGKGLLGCQAIKGCVAGLLLSAWAGPGFAKSDRIEVDLQSLRAGALSTGTPQQPALRPHPDIHLQHGEIKLDGQAEWIFDLTQAALSASITLRDPRPDSVFELSAMRGPHELNSVRFGPARYANREVRAWSGEAIRLESDQPFDRLRIREIQGSSHGEPEYISRIVLHELAPSQEEAWASARQAIAEFSSGSNSPGPERTNARLTEVAQGGLNPNTEEALFCQLPLAAVYNVLFSINLTPLGNLGTQFGGAVANLALKGCPTVLVPRGTRRVRPFGESCTASVRQDRMHGEYENILGFPAVFDSNWGSFGKPAVFHHNTEVDLSLIYGSDLYGTAEPPVLPNFSPELLLSEASLDATDGIWDQCHTSRYRTAVRFSQLDGEGPKFECPMVVGTEEFSNIRTYRTLEFPVGYNTVKWRATPRLSPIEIFSPFIPGLPAGAKASPYKEIMFEVVKEIVVTAIDLKVKGWRTAGFTEAYQSIDVYDTVPPEITPAPYNTDRITASVVDDIIHVTIEADEAGGVTPGFYEDHLESLYSITDACGRETVQFPSYPQPELRAFWPVSTLEDDNSFIMTWTVRDMGPNPILEQNEVSTTMKVEVVDLQPPAIVAPPDIVEIDLAEVHELGQPMVFDFVDLEPVVTNDATLPLGLGLHLVTWTATDSSGNEATDTQVVNVKNSNLAPVALAQTGPDRASAVSFEPETIRLEGSDADGDPLTFFIEDTPSDGFFVAPLYPFFVEDFRVEQSFTDGELWDQCQALFDGGYEDFSLDFPSDPQFFQVTEDGRWIVLDSGYIHCAGSPDFEAVRTLRVAVFGAEGGLLDEWKLQSQSDTYTDLTFDELENFIYITHHSGGGAGAVTMLDISLVKHALFRLNNINDRDTGSPVQFESVSYIPNPQSVVVDDNQVMYILSGTSSVYALDATLPPGHVLGANVTPDYIGTVFGCLGCGTALNKSMALDSEQSLYNSRANRIYKYSASFLVDGLPEVGELTGWLGRCDQDLAPGDQAVCDVTNHRSLGFSCTDELCGNTQEAWDNSERIICDTLLNSGPEAGCRSGQFRGANGIAIDANDVLYVADTGNQRIQRFTPDGFFAGKADSACDGSCFILGDFGAARDVSVNTRRFYVLDPATNLMHVSLTTPFTDRGADWAELVYQSNNDFACANSLDCIDEFAFSVSDGVRNPSTGRPLRSATASVEVEVSRNFRPPFATPGISAIVMEDTPTPVPLDGSDPDPLDSLDFAISQQPENGMVQIQGDNAVYTPSQDYTGEDLFYFTATDGNVISDPEPVQITVLNENDAPIMSALEPVSAGQGYQVTLMADFTDPDIGEVHRISVDWGDGTVEQEGSFDSNNMPTGPILSAPERGVGVAMAKHIYSTAGDFTLEVCVSDQIIVDGGGNKSLDAEASLTDCTSTMVSVSSGLDLELVAAASSERVEPGDSIVYDLTLKNLLPDAGPGQTATGVELSVDLDRHFVEDSAIAVATPGCDVSGWSVSCSVGSLASGSSFELELTVTSSASAPVGDWLLSTASVIQDQEDIKPNNTISVLTSVVPPADHYVGESLEALADGEDSNPGDGVCETSDGVCTLRAAIQENAAQGGGQVVLLGRGVYALDSNLTIADDLTIIGLGPDKTRIDLANNQISNLGGTTLHIESLTIAGGSTAVYANGDLYIRKVRFTDNITNFFFGAAILAFGLLDIEDSTFDGNFCDNDGVIFALGSASGRLSNVTFSGNTGGALTLTSGTWDLSHLTMIDNIGGDGWSDWSGSLNVWDSATATVVNSVVVGNFPSNSEGPVNCVTATGSSLTSLGNNVFGDLTGCDVSLLGSDQLLEEPQLGLLQENGAGLPSLSPLEDSPLIDAANPAYCPPTDSHGRPRPSDGNYDGVAACDIGAVEAWLDRIFWNSFE